MIVSGQVICHRRLLESLSCVILRYVAIPEILAEAVPCLAALHCGLRPLSSIFAWDHPARFYGLDIVNQNWKPKERTMDQALDIISVGKLLHVKVTGKLTKEA